MTKLQSLNWFAIELNKYLIHVEQMHDKCMIYVDTILSVFSGDSPYWPFVTNAIWTNFRVLHPCILIREKEKHIGGLSCNVTPCNACTIWSRVSLDSRKPHKFICVVRNWKVLEEGQFHELNQQLWNWVAVEFHSLVNDQMGNWVKTEKKTNLPSRLLVLAQSSGKKKQKAKWNKNRS